MPRPELKLLQFNIFSPKGRTIRKVKGGGGGGGGGGVGNFQLALILFFFYPLLVHEFLF